MSEQNSLNADASLGEDGFAPLRSVLQNHKPDSFVEFGSGRSTVRFVQLFPEIDLLSIEHHPLYYQKTAALIKEFDVGDVAELSLRPLVWQAWFGAPHRSYGVGPFPDNIDTVLIDGPPGLFNKRGREACLYQIYDRLEVGGLVSLDDFGRTAEQCIVSNWMRSYPESFVVEYLDTPHGTCLLKKVKQVEGRRDLGRSVDVLHSVVDSKITEGKVWLHRRIFGENGD